MERKHRFIDLFAGCGGLEDGFLQTGMYTDVAAVEWLKPQVDTLIHRLETKWGIKDANERVMRFDIQREQELFNGWDDPEFGTSPGLDHYVNESGGVDIIIGGPPCQAYSVAGRVRDENGMKDDYRNFLFEHYLKVVSRYSPKLFVFENVPGILSANPQGVPIRDLIREEFNKIGYEIISDLKQFAKVNAADYGVPQNRERVIILGLKRDQFTDPQIILQDFYTTLLPRYKSQKIITVKEAIGDLPKIIPVFDEDHHRKRISYLVPESEISWHTPRYQNVRDLEIYGLLEKDLATGENKYADSAALSKLYEERVGSKSDIHRYHVLRPDQPSTTIIAHLHKDGNRFIHYDPEQMRSLTPREAARLQSFDDDYEFVGAQGHAYQMIGNAVPPKLAKCIAFAINDLLTKYQN